MRRDIAAGIVGAAIASYFLFRNYQTTNQTYRNFEISPIVYKPEIIPVDTKKLYTSSVVDPPAKAYEPKYKVEVKPSVHQDSYSLDTYMELPLETDGKTHKTDVLYKDIEELEPVVEPKFVRYLRFRCTETRNASATTVHVGGFRFYNGMNLSTSKPIHLWNPHEGTTRLYKDDAWSDSDQHTVIFQFSEPVLITKYELKSSYESADFDPHHWKIEGSLGASFWEVLDDRTGKPTGFPVERGRVSRYQMQNV
jgi:hypothetical protein